MTEHARQLILVARDERLDPAAELYLAEHLATCGECRAFRLQLERADRLIALPEAAVAVPSRIPVATDRPRLRLAAAGAVVLLLVGLVAGSALRQLRQPAGESGVAQATASPPRTFLFLRTPPLGDSLGGVRLEASPEEVRAALGEPLTAELLGNVQWRYSDVRIIFDGLSLDRPGRVVRVLAQPPSGLRTSEGFTAGGTVEEFRRAYQVYWVASVGDRPLATLTVNGLDARGRDVTVSATFDGTGRAITLGLFRGRVSAVAPATVLPSRTPLAVGPYQADSRWREELEAAVRDVRTRLAIRPLIPDYVTFQVMPAVSLRSGCGLATTDCIEYRFQVPGETAYVYVLQGAAGCCLDAARPNATLGVEIRPGVRGQLIPNQDEFGGPILWWVEETAPGSRVYVALSGPNVADGELIKIARSMRPLQP